MACSKACKVMHVKRAHTAFHMIAVLNSESMRATTTKLFGSAESVFPVLIHTLAGSG